MYVIDKERVLQEQAQAALAPALPKTDLLSHCWQSVLRDSRKLVLVSLVNSLFGTIEQRGLTVHLETPFSCPLYGTKRVGCFQKQKHLLHLSCESAWRV